MGKEIKPVPTPITLEEEAEFRRLPVFMMEFYQKRLLGMSNLTKTEAIKQAVSDLEFRIAYIKKIRHDK